MSTIFEGHGYVASVDQRRGTLYVELRCAACDEVHRLMVWEDQLDAIRALAMTSDELYSRASLIGPGVAEAHARAADIVRAFVWQLTHATAHAEARAREEVRLNAFR